MPKPKKKVPTDWEAIEREYRAGQLSVSEIARQYGISHTAINKKAKAEGWVKNLAKQVRETVSARLVSDEVSKANARETIDAAASRGVEVVRSHRKDIASARARTERIGAQVERLAERIDTMQPDDPHFHSLIDTAARANSQLTQALARVIPLERQAFSLDDPTKDDSATALSAEQVRRMAREVAEQDG